MDNLAYADMDLEKDTQVCGLELKDVTQKLPDAHINCVKAFTYEEAISIAKCGKFQYFLELICGFCLMMHAMETQSVSIALPFIQRDLGASVSEQGYLVSAGYLGIVLSSHPMGFLADTWGRIRVLRASLILSILTSLCSAFSINTWMLIIFRFLNGIVICGIEACAFTFVGEFHGDKSRTKFVTFMSTFSRLARMVMPAVGLVVLPLQLNATLFDMEFKSWRLMFLGNIALSVLSFLCLLLIPESPKFLLIQGHQKKSLKILSKIFASNTGKPCSEYPVQKISVEIEGATFSGLSGIKEAANLIWTQTIQMFYKERVLHTINFGMVLFLLCFISQGIYMWYTTILTQMSANAGSGLTTCEVMNLSTMNSTIVSEDLQVEVVDVGLYNIMILAGSIFVINIVFYSLVINYVGKKNLVLASIGITICSCLAINWVTSFALAVFVFTLICAAVNCFSIFTAIVTEYYPTNINVMALCLLVMMDQLGSVCGSNFIGFMLYRHCNLLFYVSVGVFIVIMILSTLLPTVGYDKTKKEKKLYNKS